MTTKKLPALIGGKLFAAADQDTSNPDWMAALAQEHRRGTSFCRCTTGAHLPLVIRRYNAGSENEHYGLAKTKGTGLDHDPDCRFFGEGSDDGDDQDALSAFETREDGTTRAHLAFSLQLAEPLEPSDTPAAPGGKSGKSRSRASETAMLFRLWRAAGLNVYRGQGRPWFKAAYAALKAAEKIVIGRKGETLADHLLIAASPKDRLVTQHNAAVLARVEAKPSRVLVLGRMRLAGAEGKLLPVYDFGSLPKALMPPLMVDNLMKRRPLVRNVLESDTGHVVVMACIEPVGAPWWKVLSMPVIPTSPNFIPAESSYEIEFENYLIDQGRQFIKPIVVDELGDNDDRPDYILLDTWPRVRCEVWGMQTPEYLEGKAERLASYEKKGQRLVSWSADPREPFPFLPAANANKE